MPHLHGEAPYDGHMFTTTTNLGAKSSIVDQDNPPFIFPGKTTHDLSKLDGGSYKPLRGYIRRLNEFYKKMGMDAPSINGRKCNFQFQPETVVRAVASSSYDVQYFFNQDPGQLTVPIPGQSTFSIKLLFNREAEVTSQRYLTKNGRVNRGAPETVADGVNLEAESPFVTGTFNQSWVTKLGVLADILVLDAVIGQGINSETVEIITKIAEKATETADNSTAEIGDTSTDLQSDAQDNNELTAKANAFWLEQTGDNPNLGNQAFLVPTPVRIVLSNNMMVEGFVLQSAVNFHKFSRNFIPTQATVELSIQALYIGFAKKTTMLTQETPPPADAGPDTSTSVEELTETQKAITDGLKSLYLEGSMNSGFEGKDLLDLLLTIGPTKPLSFAWTTTREGYWFVKETLVPLVGGEPEWFWEGQIAMYWNSYMDGAPTPRGLLRTSAGGGQLLKGFPPQTTLQQWGKAGDRLIVASGSGPLKTHQHLQKGGGATVYSHVASQTNPWSLNLPDGLTVPKPYEEDKFTVVVALNFKVDVLGTFFDVGQILTYKQTVAAGDDVLFNTKLFSFIPFTEWEQFKKGLQE